MPRKLRHGIGTLALLAAGLLSAIGCERQGDAVDPESLSLIWISLDTLRADHLGAYGYERDTSPFIDELARDGLVFEWAIAPQNSTLPSHVTQFTGLHPVVHGVMHASPKVGVRLRDFVPTLPQVLREHGLRTHGWVDGGKVSSSYGFARGFETYDDQKHPLPAKFERVLAQLDEIGPGHRFFFFVQTYEIHSPYEPPQEYAELFREAGAPRARAALNDYDGSIRYVDEQLRDFMAALELRGVLDSTVVVITSDHGESFEEYGIDHIGHGAFNLHQNLTRVPWIVIHPDPRHRGRVEEPVGLIDFPSTMLALLGLDPALLGQGSNVVEPADREGRAYVSWTGKVERMDGPAHESWSLYADVHHLLASEDPPGPERNALYDVRSEPGEKRAMDDSKQHARLRARLDQRRSELEAERDAQPEPMAERRALPQTLISELVALGYVIETVDDVPEAQAKLHERRTQILLERRKQLEEEKRSGVTPRSPAPADAPAARP